MDMSRTIEDFVGNTPLVRLKRMPGRSTNNGNVMLAKLEGNNPAGSVKDRPALSMIVRAEERGDDQAGRHADRGDQRQHRHRAGDGRGDARLPHGADHAGAPVGGAAADACAPSAREIILTPKAGGMEGARDLAEQHGRARARA